MQGQGSSGSRTSFADRSDDWQLLRREALTVDTRDVGSMAVPVLHSAGNLYDVVTRRIAELLGTGDVRPGLIRDIALEAAAGDAGIIRAAREDAHAVIARDPAATRLVEPILFYKGYHALQTHRIAHWLWKQDRRDFAYWLQSRASEVFQVDIHPAARFGQGIFLDHATGFTVGETAVVDDDVSILHGVTLGGTGTEEGVRHPQIRRGVLIGAGAKILGNIEVGEAAKVAAGSVVLQSVAAFTTVAGVPARQVSDTRRRSGNSPSETMDQLLDEQAYASFDYVI